MAAMKQIKKPQINSCLCGYPAAVSTAYDCGIEMDVYRVACSFCSNATSYYLTQIEAMENWNNFQTQGGNL